MPRGPRLLDPQRIALVKPSALGDIVHALPVLSALKHRFPASTISWIVNAGYAPLLRGHPHLDEVIPFDRGLFRQPFTTSTRAFAEFVGLVRRRRFDLVIDLQGLARTGIMTLLTGARHRLGLSSAREGSRYCYSHLIEDDRQSHAVDRYWRVASWLGAGEGPKEFHVPLQADALARADAWLDGLPRPWLVLAVGARWLTKRWPPEHFAALANAARERHGGTAIAIGAPDEAPLAQTTLDLGAGPGLNLCGQTSLPELAAVIARADLVLANDTGPLHLAAALGRPVVAPYTCTEIRRHGPYGQLDAAVATSVSCHGSYVRQCAHRRCMAELAPERLRPRVFEVLRSWPRSCRSA